MNDFKCAALFRTSRFFVAAAVLTGFAASAWAAKPVTLPSGVVVQTVKEGKGAKPSASDTVTVHYRGTLVDGTEFDSSYSRGRPASFPLARVIPCWTQGVQQMKVGGKAKLTCPADTAYGAREIPGKIPANSTLHFDVELLDIAK
jgi:FKBP-type peptidyl-prolyl cis-trans isomerase FkpA